MLKVKAERFDIQGTGPLFSFKHGEIVADEIFVKFFPENSGEIILKGLLKEKILEEVAERKTEKKEETKQEKKEVQK